MSLFRRRRSAWGGLAVLAVVAAGFVFFRPARLAPTVSREPLHVFDAPLVSSKSPRFEWLKESVVFGELLAGEVETRSQGPYQWELKGRTSREIAELPGKSHWIKFFWDGYLGNEHSISYWWNHLQSQGWMSEQGRVVVLTSAKIQDADILAVSAACESGPQRSECRFSLQYSKDLAAHERKRYNGWVYDFSLPGAPDEVKVASVSLNEQALPKIPWEWTSIQFLRADEGYYLTGLCFQDKILHERNISSGDRLFTVGVADSFFYGMICNWPVLDKVSGHPVVQETPLDTIEIDKKKIIDVSSPLIYAVEGDFIEAVLSAELLPTMKPAPAKVDYLTKSKNIIRSKVSRKILIDQKNRNHDGIYHFSLAPVPSEARLPQEIWKLSVFGHEIPMLAKRQPGKQSKDCWWLEKNEILIFLVEDRYHFESEIPIVIDYVSDEVASSNDILLGELDAKRLSIDGAGRGWKKTSVNLDSQSRYALPSVAPETRSYLVSIPDSGADLFFGYSLLNENDCVDFVITEGTENKSKLLFRNTLDGYLNYRARAWNESSVSLDAYSGKKIQLNFETKAPACQHFFENIKGKSGKNIGLWGDPILLGKSADKNPNVIFIVLDTLRADRLGVHGNTNHLTPNLDRLAGDGVFFSWAFSAAPWTRASIFSLLSGRLPSEHIGEPDGAFPPGLPLLAEYFREAGYVTTGMTANTYASQKVGFGRLDTFFENKLDDASLRVDRALQWLQTARSAPFFLYFHLNDAHQGYHCRNEEGEWTEVLSLPHGSSPEKLEAMQKMESCYDSEVKWMDKELGRLFDFLKTSGLDQSTMIWVTADHGEEFWEHGSFEHGHTLYNELLHVPLLVSWPGVIPKGREESRPISHLDVLPTVLGLAGLSPEHETRGHSWAGWLRGKSIEEPAPLDHIAELALYGSEKKALFSKDYKYIFNSENGFEELFLFKNDLGENDNIVDLAPEVLNDFRQKLFDHLLASSYSNKLVFLGNYGGRISGDIVGNGKIKSCKFFSNRGSQIGECEISGNKASFSIKPFDGYAILSLDLDESATQIALKPGTGFRKNSLKRLLLGEKLVSIFPKKPIVASISDLGISSGISRKIMESKGNTLLFWSTKQSLKERQEINEEALQELKSLGYVD